MLDDMVTSCPDTIQLDWDIQSALDAGDMQRVQELSQIKYDMN